MCKLSPVRLPMRSIPRRGRRLDLGHAPGSAGKAVLFAAILPRRSHDWRLASTGHLPFRRSHGHCEHGDHSRRGAMSWLSRVRNSLSAFAKKRETPDDLWVKCPRCQDMLFTREFEANLYVCPRCEYHGRIGADARLAQLLDEGYQLLPAPQVREDPLKFRDSKKYTDRLKQARAANPHEDAFAAAIGTIDGRAAVVGVQDFNFMAGSMGMAVGEAFVAGAQKALDARCGYIVVTAAGGARMQEGILSLMQMPKATVMTRR